MTSDLLYTPQVLVAFYSSSIAVGIPKYAINRDQFFKISDLVVQEDCMKLLSRIAKLEMLHGLVHPE